MTSPRGDPTDDTTATVLVTEDDVDSERDLRIHLEAAGHRVISAREGAAALRMLSVQPVDLVLCQAALPDMDGIEVCRAIKRAPATKDIPVVLLIAAADDLLRQRAVEAGADDVAVTPVQQATLLTLVRAQLRITRLKSQINELEGVVVTLARAVEDRDHHSAGLAEKVAHWAMQLGTAIGLPDDQLTFLYKAALLHDVGTLSVPVGVLAKEGRLDPGEFSQVKRHPVVGEEILAPLPSANQLLPAVRHHHERVDGAGYPDGLGGDQIPLFARIIAIADAFVAMTSDRPYRRRRTRDEAIRTLEQGAGKQWDAMLVGQFLHLVNETGATDTLRQARSAG
jgi:putative two-component system response regulator